jgi:hypothetical protein
VVGSTDNTAAGYASEPWVAFRSLLQAQNAVGATVDFARLTAVTVIASRSLNLQVNESNPIFERYRIWPA